MHIKKILGFALGYFCIFEALALTNIKLEWWQYIMIIIGGCIISIINVIWPPH